MNSVKELCESIWHVESFCELTGGDNNHAFWSMIRMKAYYALAKQLDLLSDPHPFNRGVQWKVKFAVGLVYSSILNIFKIFALIRADVVVFEHSRTKDIGDGLLADMYSHHYCLELEEGGKRVLVFSRTENGFVEKNDGFQRFNIDLIEVCRALIGKIAGEFKIFSPASASSIIQKINKQLRVEVNGNIQKLLRKGGAEYAVSYSLYRIIFSLSFKLKEVVLIDGYSARAGIIAAAKDAGIKVTELQHGVITKYHLGYSYPHKELNTRFMPDEILVWSEFWKEVVEGVTPIPVKTHPNRFFEGSHSKYTHIKRKENSVVIISQGAISTQLSDIVLLNMHRFEGFDVFYKLHPSEYKTWKTNESLVEILKYKNFTLVLNEDLYELFTMCEYQVGVFSTALFEGLECGCKLVVVDLPGSEYMECVDNKVMLEEFG